MGVDFSFLYRVHTLIELALVTAGLVVLCFVLEVSFVSVVESVFPTLVKINYVYLYIVLVSFAKRGGCVRFVCTAFSITFCFLILYFFPTRQRVLFGLGGCVGQGWIFGLIYK